MTLRRLVTGSPTRSNGRSVCAIHPSLTAVSGRQLELTKYHSPATASADPQNPAANTLGLHRVMFAVADIDDTIARLRTHGAELLGEVAQYESSFRLCYLRGPAGIIVALAEQIG